MFSKRTAWERTGAAQPAHGEVIDLTVSNPTQAGLGLSDAELRARIAPAGSARYEPEPFGIATARGAVAAYYGSRGDAGVSGADVILSASTSEAYSWLFKLLCDPGDGIAIPVPGYPLFDCLAELENVAVRPYLSHWDGDAWRIDRDSLAAAATGARAIVVVAPSNPTGAFLTAEERLAIDDIAAANGAAVIADEVFFDYPFPRHEPERARSFASGECRALTFVLSGLSKVLALPQLKLGWTVVRGPARAKAEALARLEIIADTYLSVGAPVQLALPSLFAKRDAIQSAIRARVRENLAALATRAAAPSPVTLLPPEGGWAAVLRFPRTKTSAEWAKEMLEAGVLVQPGHLFGFADEGLVVVSLLIDAGAFARGLARLP